MTAAPPRVAWRAAPYALVALTLAAMAAAVRVDVAIDLTRADLNTVPPAATALARRIETPLTLTAVMSADNPARGAVETLYRRYARGFDTFDLAFAPPATIPEAIRAGRRQPGEVYLDAGPRSARVDTLDDAGMLGALSALARDGEPWVAFVTGHGERRVDRRANHDLSLFAESLGERAVRVVEFDPYETDEVPDNTDLLVVASPRVAPDPAHVAAIERYLARGGHLMMIEDPDDFGILDALDLPVRRMTGTVVDPASQFRSIDDPTFVVVDAFPDHPALAGFDLPVLVPRAFALKVRRANEAGFDIAPLLLTGERAWQEADPVAGQVGFDADRDTRGPLLLAAALTREVTDADGRARTQRIVVMGDGDIAANAYLANGGNRAFMTRVVEWLVSPAGAIADDVGPDRHPVLDLTRSHPLAYVGAAVFFLAIPFALTAHAARLAWRQRRA